MCIQKLVYNHFIYTPWWYVSFFITLFCEYVTLIIARFVYEIVVVDPEKPFEK